MRVISGKFIKIYASQIVILHIASCVTQSLHKKRFYRKQSQCKVILLQRMEHVTSMLLIRKDSQPHGRRGKNNVHVICTKAREICDWK